MSEKLILNGESYIFSESDLPCLVTYGEHMGGSHLTITLIANLFLSGSKILFLTAYPMAREDFLEQIGADHSRVAFVESISELKKALNTQAVILKSGDDELFLEVVKNLPDLHERVVLIKNIEVFNEAVFDASLFLEKIVLSGDIDACVSKEKITKKNFQTVIAFNQPQIDISLTVPLLEKYTGFLSSDIKEGVVTVREV